MSGAAGIKLEQMTLLEFMKSRADAEVKKEGDEDSEEEEIPETCPKEWVAGVCTVRTPQPFEFIIDQIGDGDYTGQEVQLKALKASELNGCFGELAGKKDKSSGRYPVKLTMAPAAVKVKHECGIMVQPDNLNWVVKRPLAAVPLKNMQDFGSQAVQLLYSDHEGVAPLKIIAATECCIESEDFLELAFCWDVIYSIPSVPVSQVQPSIHLEHGEYVHNTEKNRLEYNAMIAAGIIEDTGKRVNVNFYKDLPVVKFVCRIDPKTLRVQSGN